MNDLRNIAVLGATGSIGKSALDVIAAYQDRFRVFALTAGSNVEKLAQLASVWRPYIIGIADESRYNALVGRLKELGINDVSVVAGDEACAAIAAEPQVDTVIQSVVGAAGVRPSFEAAKAGKKLLLANKESVVCGGEHNAVAQCLASASAEARENAVIWLTCSGGPFRDKPDLDLSTVTPEMALNHPTWSMGAKITIDSATLMNKGFEVLEASHLFGISPERVEVVVHRESIIHSAVEYIDNTVIAEMSVPDMRACVQYAVDYPERTEGTVAPLDLFSVGRLTFARPDTATFPLLSLAAEAGRLGGGMGAVLNAADEVAVEAFLREKLTFTGIFSVVTRAFDKMRRVGIGCERSVDALIALDRETRAYTETLI